MLKRQKRFGVNANPTQPPSGGCVLKLLVLHTLFSTTASAAFGRLCVETNKCPAHTTDRASAAFGRLCVETDATGAPRGEAKFSRLRAAVC